jgi:hypothetical protein
MGLAWRGTEDHSLAQAATCLGRPAFTLFINSLNTEGQRDTALSQQSEGGDCVWRGGGIVPSVFQALVMPGFAAGAYSATWRNGWRNGLPMGSCGLRAADQRLVRLAQ